MKQPNLSVFQSKQSILSLKLCCLCLMDRYIEQIFYMVGLKIRSFTCLSYNMMFFKLSLRISIKCFLRLLNLMVRINDTISPKVPTAKKAKLVY